MKMIDLLLFTGVCGAVFATISHCLIKLEDFMTTLSGKIIHEANTAIFEVLGDQFKCSFITAEGVVIGLLATQEKSSLVFTNIFLSRCFLITTPIPTYQRQCMSTWNYKGPVDVETFIKLIRFNRSLVFENWERYLQASIHAQTS